MVLVNPILRALYLLPKCPCCEDEVGRAAAHRAAADAALVVLHMGLSTL